MAARLILAVLFLESQVVLDKATSSSNAHRSTAHGATPRTKITSSLVNLRATEISSSIIIELLWLQIMMSLTSTSL